MPPLFPERASTMAGRVDALYFFLLAIAIFFSLLIAGLIVFYAVRYRRRSPDEADHAMRQLLAGAARDLAPAYNRARPKQGSLRTATGVMSSSQRDRSSVQGRARQPKEERQ